MINIGISLFASDGGKSGISQYMINLMKNLEKLDQENVYTLFMAKEDEHLFSFLGKRFERIAVRNCFNKPLCNIIWHQTVFIKYLRQRRFDVVFMPAANRRLTFFKVSPIVGTLHDLSQFHVKGKYGFLRTYYIQKVLPKLALKMDKIITPSQSTKDDIIKYYGMDEKKIQVVHNGIDHETFFSRDKTESFKVISEKYHIPTDYILYISRLEHPGKNHVRLIEAYAKLKKENGIHQKLVLAGGKWSGCEKIYETIERLNLKEDVIFPGFVKQEDLPLMYTAADLFVFPSLFEGFGIPIIEAMASGVPVICSNISSMPEIAGDAAMFFDPYSVDDVAKKIIMFLGNEGMRDEFIKKGRERAKKFTWKNSAQETLSILEEVAGKKGGS